MSTSILTGDKLKIIVKNLETYRSRWPMLVKGVTEVVPAAITKQPRTFERIARAYDRGDSSVCNREGILKKFDVQFSLKKLQAVS